MQWWEIDACRKTNTNYKTLTAQARKFSGPGDVDEAVEIITRSGGVTKTKQLALAEAEFAVDSLMKGVEPSEYRDALVHLAHKVLVRKS